MSALRGLLGGITATLRQEFGETKPKRSYLQKTYSPDGKGRLYLLGNEATKDVAGLVRLWKLSHKTADASYLIALVNIDGYQLEEWEKPKTYEREIDSIVRRSLGMQRHIAASHLILVLHVSKALDRQQRHTLRRFHNVMIEAAHAVKLDNPRKRSKPDDQIAISLVEACAKNILKYQEQEPGGWQKYLLDFPWIGTLRWTINNDERLYRIHGVASYEVQPTRS